MVNRARPSMSPAEAKRHHAELRRSEDVLGAELAMAEALVDLIDSGRLDRDAPRTRSSGIQATTTTR